MDVIFKHGLGILGFIIGLIMLTLTYFERVSGCPLTYDQCTMIMGAGTEIFDFDWVSWNLVVVLGAMLGGFVAVNFMSDPSNVSINPKLSTCNIWYRCSKW
jgi:hypothetical protein